MRDSLFRFDQVVRSRHLGGRHFDWVQWDLLRANAEHYGRREAMADTFGPEIRRRTWGDVFDEVNTMIFHLSDAGLLPGDTVFSHLPACLESAYLDMATSKLRAKHLGLNVDLGRAEVLGLVAKVRPKLAIIVAEWHDRPFIDWYREALAGDPELVVYVAGDFHEPLPKRMFPLSDLLSASVWNRYQVRDLDYMKTDPLAVHELLPTAGTTGIPKVSQRTTLDWFHVHSVAIAERAQHTVYDSRILIGPLSGGSGRLWGVHTPLYTGGKVIYLTEFDEQAVFTLTEQENLTIWTWNPALITRLVTSPRFDRSRLATLRNVSYSGAPLPGNVIAKLFERGVKPFNVYGTSEVGGCMSPILAETDTEHLLAAAGVPLEGFDVAVVDAQGNRLEAGEAGEILIWNVHSGYLNNPEESELTYRDREWGGRWDGYQRTGDLGMYDAQGYLSVVGRKKDMILRGAQNIFPKEVEDHLSAHPKIHDAAVVGAPDPVLGERAVAFLVIEGNQPLELDEIREYLSGLGLAKYKWPEQIECIAELPLGPGGKVKKDVLRSWLAKRVSNS